MPVKSPDDYFALFNLTPVFDVNPAELATRYRELQRMVHPDRFAAASDAERLRAVRRAAEVNDAFQTLKDPVRRARYLLELKGVDTDDETDTVMDPAFLMEQLELRERLEQAQSREGAARAQALASLRETFMHRFDETTRAFEAAFAHAHDLAAARARVRELQFLRKLIDQVDSAGEET